MDSLYWHSLKLGLLTDSNHEKKKLTLLIGTTTLAFLSFIFTLNMLYSRFKPEISEEPAVLGVTDTLPTQSPPSPTPAPTSIPTIAVFEATLSAKPLIHSTPGLFLADVIVDALKIPLIAGKPYPLKKILYDTNKVASTGAIQSFPYDSHFFVVLTSPLSIPPEAESAYIRITTKPVSPNLLPYLLDTTYCQSNSDCLVRESMCQENAFNKYDLFLDNYSCKPLVPAVKESPEYSALYGCYLSTKASPPLCNQNHCQLTKEKSCL